MRGTDIHPSAAAMLADHERIALQFSGGKDSLAVATLLRPHADRITVYWAHGVDVFPETQAAINWCRQHYKRFAEIQTPQPPGVVSDLIPADATIIGRMATGSTRPHLLDRYACCYLTLMKPMAQRMEHDGVTLVIRGQKRADALKSPIPDAHIEAGRTYWFPLEHWTDADVFDYLRAEGTPIPEYYGELKGGLDCAGCSAWWPERRMAWLTKHHPEIAGEVTAKLMFIAQEVAPAMDALGAEMENCRERH
jgi:3'-phosphoadenosine 5'-phosphosulfate sulfotransferase (PAPS reductase)/FAD synthetase